MSFRRGLPLESACAMTLHFPGFLPFFLSFTIKLPSVPQVGDDPEGTGLSADAPHLPFTLTVLSAVAVHVASASLTHTLSLKVQDPFGVLIPSASQAGSQSPHWITPPFLSASGTSPKSTRHSVVASITAWLRGTAATSATPSTIA